MIIICKISLQVLKKMKDLPYKFEVIASPTNIQLTIFYFIQNRKLSDSKSKKGEIKEGKGKKRKEKLEFHSSISSLRKKGKNRAN